MKHENKETIKRECNNEMKEMIKKKKLKGTVNTVKTKDKYKSNESDRRKECKMKTKKKEGNKCGKKKTEGWKRMTQQERKTSD